MAKCGLEIGRRELKISEKKNSNGSLIKIKMKLVKVK